MCRGLIEMSEEQSDPKETRTINVNVLPKPSEEPTPQEIDDASDRLDYLGFRDDMREMLNEKWNTDMFSNLTIDQCRQRNEELERIKGSQPETEPQPQEPKKKGVPSGLVSLLPKDRQQTDLMHKEFDSEENLWQEYSEALKKPHDTEEYQQAKQVLPQIENKALRWMLKNPNRTYNLDSVPSESTPSFPNGLGKNHSYTEYSQYLRELIQKHKHDKKE
jgi:GTP cyclohydrolase II